MQNYKDLLQNILDNGESSKDRTGTGTTRIFGTKLEFDCSDTLPIVTTKYIHLKSIIHELLWFIRGDTNLKYLQDNGITIWEQWADYKNEIGPMYGAQWRNAGGSFRHKIKNLIHADGIDQLANCIQQIKYNPTSRRIIVDAYDVQNLPDETLSPVENVSLGKMALAPCHMFFQFFVHNSVLDIQVYQRSVDVFLGLPFNITSYALLLKMICNVTDTLPGKLIWVGGDTHIYNNHRNQVNELLSREPLPLPTIEISKVQDIDDYVFDDFNIINYTHHPAIKGAISV